MRSSPPSLTTASHPILDELQSSLHHGLTVLEEKWEHSSLSLTSIPSLTTTGAERTFRLEASDDLIAQLRFGVYPLGAGTYEVYIAFADGPTRRLTYDSTREDDPGAGKAWLGRTATSVVLEEIEPRLGRIESRPSPPQSESAVPRIDLDCDGRIRHLNSDAEEIFDDSGDLDQTPSFFAYVHGRNLRRVIRDLAHMGRGEMQSARWLLRLQTGADRWHWYRVRATNQLESEETIRIHLHPLNSPQHDPTDDTSQ
jgi:hypothetical protein